MRVALDAADELVVHRKAVRCQAAKLRDVTFDLRGENASGGARGAMRDTTGIKQLNARAATRQLVSDGTPHDARADDGDLHKEILSGPRLSTVNCKRFPPRLGHTETQRHREFR
jgi:hypothetical protein